MGGSGGDIVGALNFQVKAEVIKNYLRERRILEEEMNEYQLLLETYRESEDAARKARDDLACLLASPEHLDAFFRNLGFSETPLAFLDYGPNADFVPACPMGLSPKGFTKRSRFVNLVIDTYGRLVECVQKGAKLAGQLIGLASEINKDISKFHLNFDLMSIIQFLKNMDADLVAKKGIMGSNFTPEEVGSIESKMSFSKLKPDEDGVRAWPELPPRRQVEKPNAELLHGIFESKREAILPALKKTNHQDRKEND